MNNKRVRQIVGAVIVAVLIAGGVGLKRKGKQEEEVMPEINLEPAKQIVEELQLPMNEAEKQAIEEKFASEGVEMTVLKDVTNGQAVGTGWRHFDGKEFVHKVEVSGLATLEKGFFYEGWLVGKDGFFSTGRLAMIDGRGNLYYTSEEDKSEFTGVVITLEPEDGNESPDKHVLEGSF